MENDNINIELTKEEAIVLFEFLARISEKEDSIVFDDQSEQRVLWNIESILEKKLNDPFLLNYSEIVERARENVRNEEEK